MRNTRYRVGVELAFILTLHIGVSLCYLHAFPVFNWPDEPAHFNYVKNLADGNGFDVMTKKVWVPDLLEKLRHDHFLQIQNAEDPIIAPICYEAHQPPLYYVVAAGVYGLTRSVFMLKLLNLLFSCLAIVFTYMIAMQLFPRKPLIPLGAGLLLALQPMRAFMAVSISNDPATECLFTIALLLILQRRKSYLIGIVAGLALLTKVHMVLILPLYLLWLLMDTQSGDSVSARLRNRMVWAKVCIAGVVCLVIASPWLWRNIQIYGMTDPFALKAGALGSHAAELDAFGKTRPALRLFGQFGIIPFVRILFQSWWGVFGWMEWFMNKTIVGSFMVISAWTCFGLIRAMVDWYRNGCLWSSRMCAVLWLTSGWMIFLLALVVYSVNDFQAQGRYLLVASCAAGVLYGIGMVYSFRRGAPLGLLLTTGILLSVNLFVTLHLIPMHLH